MNFAGLTATTQAGLPIHQYIYALKPIRPSGICRRKIAFCPLESLESAFAHASGRRLAGAWRAEGALERETESNPAFGFADKGRRDPCPTCRFMKSRTGLLND